MVLALLGLLAGAASAQTIDLVADEFDWNGIPMWGFADDSAGTHVCGSGGVWAPGPTIEVDLSTTIGLIVNLKNCLTEPVSLVIPGQTLKGSPQFNGDGRVRSFTAEAAAFDGVTAGAVSYSWTNAELKPGTFLYSSGTHPARQVHMGLYGAAVVNVSAGEAYPGVFFDSDIVVLYSEVDPALHAAGETAKPLNFKPKFFLVNGDAEGNSVLTATPAPLNSQVLLRFVNAGLKAYVPTLLGEDMDWVAEDGNPYPFARRSYSAFLGAGKTMDAIWVPVTEDRHTLYDRRLHLTANSYPVGGLRAFLDSGFVALPIADAGPDQLHVPMFTGGAPTVVTLSGGPAAGVTYEWVLTGFPAGSAALLSDPTIANPSFTLDVPGTYTAQLVVNDGTDSSAPDTVNIFTNLPPVAIAAGDGAVDVGATVALDGSDSYDPDAVDTITSYDWVVTAPDASTIIPASGAASSFLASQVGTYEVELTVSDGELSSSDTFFVTSSAPVNQPPNAGNDFFEVIWKTTDNVLFVLANDSDGDGTIDPASLAIVTNPMNGATAVPSAGTILYTPKNGFKGTDFFTYEICDDLGACSEAEVLVNVVK
jgi:FtsP/CotA-like multicopper oxidase with cupredoxin domain